MTYLTFARLGALLPRWIFTFLWGLFPCVVVADFTPTQMTHIKKIEAYLNGISTLQANVIQENTTGTQIKGRLYLNRLEAKPFGQLRLEYSLPATDLLVINGEELIHTDKQTKEINRYPVEGTPAAFLVRPKIRFSKDSDDLTLNAIEIEDDLTTLTVTSRQDFGSSQLVLVFETKPFLILKGWVLQDGQGNTTRVALHNVEIGIKLDAALFKP